MNGATRVSIGIIGGGSAGYLAALALASRCPHVDLTLIESSATPPIGVGEGTTPTMLPFLQGFVGIDIEELVADVQPTWKLGVRLDWGPARGTPFQFPFAAPHLADSYARTGSINTAGLATELMHRRAGLHVLDRDLSLRSLAGVVPFAYHLDNRRFVAYLARVAARKGIRLVDAHLVGHHHRPDGALAAVVSDDGRSFTFDLFIDCSGFRSTLLGGALGVGFKSYASSLFTDAALVGSAPIEGTLAPFTRADTLAAGWCWSVPQLEEDRRGYVFSTAHLSLDAADAEMRRHCPGLGETCLVRFTSGRRTTWWARNVVAIGNAYGFVEPLQATALHMIVHEITILVQRLATGQRLDDCGDEVNRHVASVWDDTCALIALHYRYNRRRNSAFWRDARASADLGALAPVIDDAIAGGSMTRLVERGQVDLRYGAARDIDLLLLGLRLVAPGAIRARLDAGAWRQTRRQIRDHADRALSAAASVRVSREHPASIDARGAPWFQAIRSGMDRPLASTTTFLSVPTS